MADIVDASSSRRTFRSSVATAVAATLVLTALSAVLPGSAASAAAASPVKKVADPATYHEYPGSTDAEGYYAVSRSSGRVWTDKSVFDTAITDLGTSGGVPAMTVADGELAVGLSALGSTRHVSRLEGMPVDTAIVLDLSTSMGQCVGSSDSCTANTGANSRVQAMVNATNMAISTILAANPENRIGVVTFQTTAATLMPLGTPSASGRYVELCSASGTLHVRTVGATCSTSPAVSGSTNIQRGIYQGMNLLLTQDPEAVAGKRMPSVLVMSDGEPTYSVGPTDRPNWWVPTSTNNVGTGSPITGDAKAYPGNGFMTALTASYLKNRVDAVYHTSATLGTKTRVFTVGFGMNALTDEGRALAELTLDPTLHYDDTGTKDGLADAFRAAFAQYRANGQIASLAASDSVNYTNIGRPAVVDADPTTLKYNDKYYAPLNAADLEKAFGEIAGAIVEAAPNFPVQVEESSPATSGFITMEDPLGDFMEVTSIDRLMFCSLLPGEDGAKAPDPTKCTPAVFANPQRKDVSSTLTRYTFTGSYTANETAGPTDLGSLVVEVTSSESLSVGDTVTVKLPAALLPMRDTRVVENDKGEPTSVEIFASHPVHLFYKVAPKAGVVEALGDPTSLNTATSSDGTALADYVANHRDASGNVQFYSNAYTVAADGTATARSSARFRPAEQNDFYRFAADTVLYSDAAATTPIAPDAWSGLHDDTVVYYTVVEYYPGSQPRKDLLVLATTKGAIVAGEDDAHSLHRVGGTLVAPEGMRDLSGRHTNLDHVKCVNLVWTDNLPGCADASGSSGNVTGTDPAARSSRVNPADGQTVLVTLGNNGILTYAQPGALRIDKTVAFGAGLDPDADATFAFQVDLTDGSGNPLPGAFPYRVYERANPALPVRSDTIRSGGNLTLEDGQFAVVADLPAGARYSVTEPTADMPAGFSQSSPAGAATGTTAAATVAEVAFTNTYAPEAAVVAGPEVVKDLTGRGWAGDVFEAELCGIGMPMPQDAEGDCVTAEMRDENVVGFGDITFTAPGTYHYTVVELPGASPGITYSGAIYRWTVTVVDGRAGLLVAGSELVDVTVADAPDPAEVATFTNTFDADSAGVTLSADKLVQDRSLPGDTAAQTRAPALSHTFAFQQVPSGAGEPTVTPADCTPTADEPYCLVTNAPKSEVVRSGELTFTSEHVGQTFYYRAHEIVDGSRDFVTHSDAVQLYRVSVGSAEVAGEVAVVPEVTTCTTTKAQVDSAPPWGTCDPDDGVYGTALPTFVNVYNPSSGTGELPFVKVLEGRPWSDGDAFEFDVTANDDVTADAWGDVLTLSGTTAVVSDGDDPTGRFTFTVSQQGAYQLAITERVPDDPAPGMAYSQHVLVYDVVVTDVDTDGVLEVVVTRHGDAEFLNTYYRTTAWTGFELVKYLDGRAQAAGEFSFSVVPGDAQAAELAGIAQSGTTVTTADDAASGEAVSVPVLRAVALSSADLERAHRYTVREVKGDAGGVTYDGARYDVTVRTAYDPADGELYTLTTVSTAGRDDVVVDSRDADAAVAAVTFRNTYTATAATATPEFEKSLTGRTWLTDDTFTFALTTADDAPLPDDAQVSVGGEAGTRTAARFDFGAITFTEPGTYEYLASEVVPSVGAPGITYDPSVVAVTVDVVDDGEGALHADVRYGGGTTFVNRYETSFDLSVDVTKTLVGRDLRAGEFDFTIVPQDARAAEVAQLPVAGATFANQDGADDGQAALAHELAAHVTQDDAGLTYCYTVTEASGTARGVTYDRTRYEVCATVADDGRGVLTVTTTVSGGAGDVTSEHRSDDATAQVWPTVSFANAYSDPAKPAKPVGPSDRPDDPARLATTGASVGAAMLGVLLLIGCGVAMKAHARRRVG